MKLTHIMGDFTNQTADQTWHCPMMGGLSSLGGGWMWFGGVFWLVTWILVVAVLVALLRWLWKKGGK